MLVIPAIDIRNGNCVRLLQGDPDRETVYSSDPVDMARRFEDLGAELIHVVDLDGAFSGETVNHEVIAKIASTVSIKIEVGGGIRTGDAVSRYVDAGISRIILGTVLLESGFERIVEQYREVLIAGVDARDSMVATHGWKEVSSVSALEIIKELKEIGISEIIYTDISTDGMLKGPNLDAIDSILSNVSGIGLCASGGVSSIDDIIKLAEFESRGLYGCIVGKAVYDGRVDLEDALLTIKSR